MPSVVEVNKEIPCFYVKGPNSAKRGEHSKKEEFMSRLLLFQTWMVTAVLSAGLAAVAVDRTRTFTGKVSDVMCGAKHNEGGVVPAGCVRACVRKGAKYALVTGDKVYTLDTSDQSGLDKLNKLAWEKARVTGTANGDAISVKSVTAAK